MDTQSENAIKFIQALASSKNLFIDLALGLRSQPGVKNVIHCIECIPYLTHSAIEGYADVELHNGKSMALCIDITWNAQQWLIISRVTFSEDSSHNPRKDIEFPDRTAETLDECIEKLHQATLDLVNSANAIIGSLTG